MVIDEKDIDQLLHGSLSSREFAFNEEHWRAMAALIDARRKKRRFIFFILFFSLLGIGTIFGLNYFNVGHDNLSQVEALKSARPEHEWNFKPKQNAVSNDQHNVSSTISPVKEDVNGMEEHHESANSSATLSSSAFAVPKNQKSQRAVQGIDLKQTPSVESQSNVAIPELKADGVRDLNLPNTMPLLNAGELPFEAQSTLPTSGEQPMAHVPHNMQFYVVPEITFLRLNNTVSRGVENTELPEYNTLSSFSFQSGFQVLKRGWVGDVGLGYITASAEVDYGEFTYSNSYFEYEFLLDSLLIGVEEIIDSTFEELTQTWFVDTLYVPVYEYIESVDSIEVTETETKKREETERHRLQFSRVELPLLVGKSVAIGKMDVQLLAGPTLTMTTTMRGYFIDGEALVARWEYDRRFQVVATGRVNLSYPVHQKWMLRASGTYRYDVTPAAIYGEIKQRHAGWGIGFGVVFRWWSPKVRETF